jgi:hypothetical protein
MTLGTADSASPQVELPPELDPRRRRRRNRPLRALTAAVSAGVVAVSISGFVGLSHYESKITRIQVFAGLNDEARPAKAPTSATNILLVGSDSREGLTRSEISQLNVGAPTPGDAPTA